jgi:DNA-binding CsgD family transcriptional regulator
MFTIQNESDLLSAVYDGPFEQPMWQTFLDRLRQRTRADYAGIFFRPPGRPMDSAIELFSGRPTADRLRQFYRDDAYNRDSIFDFLLREERVYTLAELILPKDTAHRAFVRDILEPIGVRAMRIVRVTEAGGITAWLSITKSQGDFASSDSALLSSIAADFRRALRGYAEIERQKVSGRIAVEMLERLNFGWISLDANGILVGESPEAAKLLQHGAGLHRTRSGRLMAADPHVDRQLSAAIRSLGRGETRRPHALNVCIDPWVDLLLTSAKVDPNTSLPGPAIIVYIQGDNRSLANRYDQIAELFGLLPSEARFALALSRGQSIAEAAESLGITMETARNYSKKVYAKMGARGQADVIRFILTSALALA